MIRRRGARRLAVLALGSVALASCTIGRQAEPEPIPTEEVPFELPDQPRITTTTVSPEDAPSTPG